MNKKIQPQKSAFSKVFERIIFVSLPVMLAGMISGQALGCSGSAGTCSIQQEKRMAQRSYKVVLRGPVDSLVVYKSKREMAAYSKGRKAKTYIISLGATPEGRKRVQGDNKTPEGVYYINGKNPNSSYHKNLGISYPNAADRQYAQAHKLNTGGDVKIHGLPNRLQYKPEAYLYSDWTWGCIAISNEEIDELYRFVQVGTPIVILP